MKKFLFVVLSVLTLQLDGSNFTDKYPEILWLAGDDVRKTEEAQSTTANNIELIRTLTSLHCLHMILEGNYVDFTKAQPENVRLSKTSFNTIHAEGVRLLNCRWGNLSSAEMLQVMEVALVLADMGKSEKARDCFKAHGVTAPDHDDFYEEALKVLVQYPELAPSFMQLPDPARQLLVIVGHMAHYGHITHLEGGPSMFTKLRTSDLARKDPIALSFDLFIHTCDVAGALGHVNNNGSLTYTEPTHKAMQAMQESVRLLADPNKKEIDAYNAYLSKRAQWLGLSLDRQNLVLARLGAMLRLFTAADGKVLVHALSQIKPNEVRKLVVAFDPQREFKCTPTYVPAVLVNLSNNQTLGNREERLTKSITIGALFVADVFLKANRDVRVPLNFNRVAGVAKTAPEKIREPFSIDREGNVNLNSK